MQRVIHREFFFVSMWARKKRLYDFLTIETQMDENMK